ncbi:MAG: tRNA (adenosine(37)-N6)-dimethylallyltransferase MiaA [Parcubacteria group bacterium]|nr:tRNA (adenosine(37)-N6)-dimethylallyltransferase MiaA [Parcubacteria group bacterium]
MKQKIIVIVGPTASGKSDCAITVAKQVNGEVISADSRQVYRGMDIGTGKITKKEMVDIPHHLLDVASPKRQFTVVQYQKLASKAIQDILKREKVPILCGGTGLYIDAVLEGWEFPKTPIDKTLRKNLEKKTTEELFDELKKHDPEFSKTIDHNNRRRLIRALEIITTTNEPITPLKKHPLPYTIEYIGLFPGWEVLQEKIKKRLKERLNQGMIEEVQHLHEKEKLSWKRLESFGLEYRYISRYLRSRHSDPEMIEGEESLGNRRSFAHAQDDNFITMKNDLEKAIIHYAKRQMTWFKRNKRIKWF